MFDFIGCYVAGSSVTGSSVKSHSSNKCLLHVVLVSVLTGVACFQVGLGEGQGSKDKAVCSSLLLPCYPESSQHFFLYASERKAFPSEK